MPSIGGFSFITVKGAVNLSMEALEKFTRPGVNGQSYQSLGRRPEVSTFTSTVDFPFSGSARNNLLAYRIMKEAGPVTIIDDHGAVWINMLILTFRQTSARRVITATGGLFVNPYGVQVVEWEADEI